MYHRNHTKIVSSFDKDDTIGYVAKNKTRNCQLDASEKYNSQFAKILIRINPELKDEFQEFCRDIGISMNAEIVSLIESDIRSN